MKETLIIILAFWLIAFSDSRDNEKKAIEKISSHIDTSINSNEIIINQPSPETKAHRAID